MMMVQFNYHHNTFTGKYIHLLHCDVIQIELSSLESVKNSTDFFFLKRVICVRFMIMIILCVTGIWMICTLLFNTETISLLGTGGCFMLTDPFSSLTIYSHSDKWLSLVENKITWHLKLSSDDVENWNHPLIRQSNRIRCCWAVPQHGRLRIPIVYVTTSDKMNYQSRLLHPASVVHQSWN